MAQMGGIAPLRATVDTNLASGGVSTTPVVSSAVTASGAGGTGPYSYDWEYVSGDAAVTVDSDLNATTTWRKAMAPATTTNAVWRCKVTDAAARVAYTQNVNIALERF